MTHKYVLNDTKDCLKVQNRSHRRKGRHNKSDIRISSQDISMTQISLNYYSHTLSFRCASHISKTKSNGWRYKKHICLFQHYALRLRPIRVVSITLLTTLLTDESKMTQFVFCNGQWKQDIEGHYRLAIKNIFPIVAGVVYSHARYSTADHNSHYRQPLILLCSLLEVMLLLNAFCFSNGTW